MTARSCSPAAPRSSSPTRMSAASIWARASSCSDARPLVHSRSACDEAHPSGSRSWSEPALARVTGRRRDVLGPRLDLRQSQSLVMTPQLQQAIRLLALVQSRDRELHRRGDGEEPAARERGAEPAATTSGAAAPRGRLRRRAGRPPTRCPRPMPAAARRRSTSIIDGEDFHQDSAADRCAARRRPRHGRASAAGGGEARARISTASPPASISLHEHLLPRPARCCRARTCSSPTRSIEQIDETGYFHASLARDRPAARRAARRGRAGARRHPDLRSRRESARATSPNASRSRRRKPIATIRPWRG